MRKNIILAIATITTLTLLAGCGAKDTAVSAAPVEESKAVEVTEVAESTPEPVATPEPVEVVAEPEVTPESTATPEPTTQTFEINSFGHMANVIVDDPDITFVEEIESEEAHKIKLKPSAESDTTIIVIMDKYTTSDAYDISGAYAPVTVLNWTLTDYDYEECNGYLVVKAVTTTNKNYGIVYPADYPYGYMELDETTGNPVGWTAHIECCSPTASCDELVELCKELYNKITVVYQEESPMAEEYNEKYLQGKIADWKAIFIN